MKKLYITVFSRILGLKIKNPFGTKFKIKETSRQKRNAIIIPFGIPIKAPKKLLSEPTIGNEKILLIVFANNLTKIISKIKSTNAIIPPTNSQKAGLINLFEAVFTAFSVPFSRFSSKMLSKQSYPAALPFLLLTIYIIVPYFFEKCNSMKEKR